MRREQLLFLAWTAVAAAGGCSVTEDVLVVGPGSSPWEEPDPRWTIEHPVFGAKQLLGACLGPDGRATIVGAGGLVLHDDGRGWRLERALGTTTALLVVIDAGDVVLAAGEGGVVLRRQGHDWVHEDTGTDAALRDLAPGPDGAVWAAGNRGILLRRDGAGWKRVPLPDSSAAAADLTALAVLGDTLAVGLSSGRVLGHAGGGWRELGDVGPLAVIDLAATAGGDLFVSNGFLHRYREGRWTEIDSGEGAVSRLAAGAGVLLHCGLYSSMRPLFLSAQTDSYSWYGYISQPTALALDEQGRALAVNQGGEILRRRDGRWGQDPAGAGLSWRARPLRDGSCVLVTGTWLLEPHEGAWRAVTVGPSGFQTSEALDGLDAGHLFCACYLALPADPYHPDYRPVLWLQRRDGGEEIPLPAQFASRWNHASLVVDAEGAPILTGYNSGVWRYAGGAWKEEMARPDSNGEWDLQRTAAGQVFAWDGRRGWQRGGERWHEVEGAVAEDEDPDRPTVNPRFAGRSTGPLLVLRYRSWGVAETGVGGGWSWGPYALTSMQYRDSGIAWAEGLARLYLEDERTGTIYSLSTRPGDERVWVPVTGLPPEEMESLHTEPDGSLVAVGWRSGRVYRYRPTASPFGAAP